MQAAFGPTYTEKIKRRAHKPKLKAKASQARCLVGFTLDLATKFQELYGELGRHRQQITESLAKICKWASQPSLSKQELASWRLEAASHIFHYACCGFSVYPKFHYFQHFPQRIQRGGVPRTGLQTCDMSSTIDIACALKDCLVTTHEAHFVEDFLGLLR
jgi:hypothetical protein